MMQLKIILDDRKPKSWRRILVPTSIRYDQLHAVIQMLFGWTNSHLHEFRPAGSPQTAYGIVAPELDMADTLSETEYFPYLDLIKGNVNYVYDFGADWQHEIQLEKMVTMADFVAAGHKQLPVVLNGRGLGGREDGNSEGVEPFIKESLNNALADFTDGWDAPY